jgi:hypothetical protein
MINSVKHAPLYNIIRACSHKSVDNELFSVRPSFLSLTITLSSVCHRNLAKSYAIQNISSVNNIYAKYY